MSSPSYEERFGAIERRVYRAMRWGRWLTKGALRSERTVLIETKWRLGDEIMTIPIFEALKQQCGNIRIQVLCNHPELLEGNPYVDAVNEEPMPAPDTYILLRGAHRNAYRIHELAERAGVSTPSARPRLYFRDWLAPQLEALSRENRPLIGVSTGATWPTKRWSLASWRKACSTLDERGYSVVQLGLEDEPIGVGISLVNTTSVREAACILHACKALLCGDSGLMHLALAAGTPVLALFGPTNPDFLIRDEPKLTSITNARPCQGCWNVSMEMIREGVCPRQIPDCLDSISPERVVNRAMEILAGRR